jgi:hypothetical protein
MKKSILLVGGLIVTSMSYGQWDQAKYDSLLERGDTLYNSGLYVESALAYEASIKMISRISPWHRWVTARSWASAGYADSAFSHMQSYASSDLPIVPLAYNVLTEVAFKNLRGDKRWNAIQDSIIKKFKLIATRYSERIRSGHWTNPTNDGYDAARAWAGANEKDSAFHYLYRIVNSNHNTFIDYPKITRDLYFTSLYEDPRWQTLIDPLKRNWKWIPTKHSFHTQDISMMATIDPGSSHLKSDGKGTYKDGVDKVVSRDQHGYNLEISGHRLFYRSGNRHDLSPRYITIDLNSPVTTSGSKTKGIINDNDLELHVLYKIDTTVSPQVVYNFREIPVGSSVEVDRAEIIFYVNDKAHVLTFGPWGFGKNNEAIAHKGKINGKGTNPVIVTRKSNSNYTIHSKPGSAGRLWNVENISNPIDLGLYHVGFIIHLQEQ